MLSFEKNRFRRIKILKLKRRIHKYTILVYGLFCFPCTHLGLYQLTFGDHNSKTARIKRNLWGRNQNIHWCIWEKTITLQKSMEIPMCRKHLLCLTLLRAAFFNLRIREHTFTWHSVKIKLNKSIKASRSNFVVCVYNLKTAGHLTLVHIGRNRVGFYLRLGKKKNGFRTIETGRTETRLQECAMVFGIWKTNRSQAK